MVELAAGELIATWYPEHGMVGASLRHRGDEVLGQRGGLDAYLAKGSAFGIPLLAPWANRLDGLRYGEVTIDPARVKGGAERLPKDGVLAGRPWEVEALVADRVAVSFDADEDVLDVFPFPFRMWIVVALQPTHMTVSTSLEARSDLPVPVSFGWHPLFTLPGVPRAELEVELPVNRETVLDTRGIPTGRFRSPDWRRGALGDRVLDHEYPGLSGDFVLRGGRRELRVIFGPGTGYPVGHAWAPAGEDFLAWEPMTAPTNALVSGEGLRHVQPGTAYDAHFTVSITEL